MGNSKKRKIKEKKIPPTGIFLNGFFPLKLEKNGKNPILVHKGRVWSQMKEVLKGYLFQLGFSILENYFRKYSHLNKIFPLFFFLDTLSHFFDILRKLTK